MNRLLASLPGQIGRETSAWVTVVRGNGRVPHPALAYKTIRNYLAYLLPVLTGWSGRYASLREATRQDILDAVDARHGPVIQHRIVALMPRFAVGLIRLGRGYAILLPRQLRFAGYSVGGSLITIWAPLLEWAGADRPNTLKGRMAEAIPLYRGAARRQRAGARH